MRPAFLWILISVLQGAKEEHRHPENKKQKENKEQKAFVF